MQVVFIGTPAPKKYLKQHPHANYISIPDNNYQNNIIQELYRTYQKNLQVITINRNYRHQVITLDCGVRAFAIPNSQKNALFHYLSLIWSYFFALKKILKNQTQKVLVLSYSGQFHTSLPIIILKFLTKKIVYLPLNSPIGLRTHPIYALGSSFSGWLLHFTDATMTPDIQYSLDFTPKKHSLEIPIPLNNDTFVLYEKIYQKFKRHSNQVFTIAYTGTLDECSGSPIMLELIKRSQGKYHWLICGSGPFASEFTQLAQNKKYNLEFLGLVSKQKVCTIQHSSDLLLTLRNLNGSGNQFMTRYVYSSKIIEYLLSGTPVLSSRIPAITVKDFSRYLYYPKSNHPHDILATIENIRQGSLDQKLLQKGRQHIKKYYTTETLRKKITIFAEKIYNGDKN